jgi:DNA-binding response OmpR family regulator
MHDLEIGLLRIGQGDRVFVAGREIHLGRQEQLLLLSIVRRRGQVCLRQDLMARTGTAPAPGGVAAVGGCIKRLRRKLGQAGRMLETVRGLGYRLASADAPARAARRRSAPRAAWRS